MNELTIELTDELKADLIKYSKKINQGLNFTIRYLLSYSLLEKGGYSKLSQEEIQKDISELLTPKKTAEFLKLLDES